MKKILGIYGAPPATGSATASPFARCSPTTAWEPMLLGDEPVDEPVVGQGPFVMNSVEEIHESFADFQQGKCGNLNG